MHQRAPRDGRLEEDDIHNEFLKKNSKDIDVLVMSVGSHEAMAWSHAPQLSLNITELEQDTDEFIDYLYNKLKFRQKLVWWKGHYFPSTTTATVFHPAARVFLDDAYAVMLEKFRKKGSLLADFYQTTIGKGLSSPGHGIHYPDLAKFHANILLNAICNSELY